jgi:hypothetical protein
VQGGGALAQGQAQREALGQVVATVFLRQQLGVKGCVVIARLPDARPRYRQGLGVPSLVRAPSVTGPVGALVAGQLAVQPIAPGWHSRCQAPEGKPAPRNGRN